MLILKLCDSKHLLHPLVHPPFYSATGHAMSDLAQLQTEGRNADTVNIDLASSLELCRMCFFVKSPTPFLVSQATHC